jgi:chromosome segregation ATPase
MTVSGQDTQEKIGYWESEIRKLWAISNKRNRTWIKDNETNLNKVRKSVDDLQSSSRGLISSVGRHETAFSQQSAIIDQLASVDLQLAQMVNAQRDLVDKVNASQQTIAGLQSGLENRVKDNEQAVAAIDAYRLQLNTRLATLERRLNNLSSAQLSDL